MEADLTQQNVVEVLINSYLVNEDLFEAAVKFIQDCRKAGKTVEKGAYEELKEVNRTLAFEILCKAFSDREKLLKFEAEFFPEQEM